MDANAIARALVAEMSDAVQRHVHPRSGQLMPPRLTGMRRISDLQLGENVLDRADALLEIESESWLPGQDPDVSLELCKVDDGWVIAWAIGDEVEEVEEVDERGKADGGTGAGN